MTTFVREPALKLDPGPAPRSRGTRTPRSRYVYKMLRYAFSLLVMGLVGYIAILIIRLVRFTPHKEMYYKHSDGTRADEVVEPLIGKDQTFDVIATVWIRDDSAEASFGDDGTGRNGAVVRGIDAKRVVEKVIFTDTIFRGVSMDDKPLKTSVQINIPTSVFNNQELSNHDLRASFVVVPNSPSPLDRATNYSSWTPSEAMYPPARNYIDGYKRSIREEVIDAYGTFTPLLSFQNIKSQCALPDENKIDMTSPWKDDSEDKMKRLKEKEATLSSLLASKQIGPDEYIEGFWKLKFEEKSQEITTTGEPSHEAHPYVITRTFLNIVNMTNPFNRTAYEQAHMRLAATSCGLKVLKRLKLPSNHADWRLCERSYNVNGNHEVMVEYSQRAGTDGAQDARTPELMYAPYLYVNQDLWGPLDLVPVPVDREECTRKDVHRSPSVQTNESFSIIWNIAFSSQPTSKRIVGFPFSDATYRKYNMTDLDDGKLKLQHAMAEFNQAIHGQTPYADRHPIFGYVLYVIGTILMLFQALLKLHYWSIRAAKSTVGISIVGTAFIASGHLVEYIGNLYFIAGDRMPLWEFLRMLGYSTIFYLESFMMLKAITRTEVRWYKRKWIFMPVGLRFAGATHAERASMRLEARIPWRYKLVFLFVLVVTSYVSSINKFYIINPQMDFARDNAPISLLAPLFFIKDYVREPMILFGQVSQAFLNKQSGTFAGMYKLGAVSCFASRLLFLVAHLPWFSFFIGQAAGVSLFTFLEVVVYAVMMIQAFKYPKVSIRVDGEEEE